MLTSVVKCWIDHNMFSVSSGHNGPTRCLIPVQKHAPWTTKVLRNSVRAGQTDHVLGSVSYLVVPLLGQQSLNSPPIKTNSGRLHALCLNCRKWNGTMRPAIVWTKKTEPKLSALHVFQRSFTLSTKWETQHFKGLARHMMQLAPLLAHGLFS